MITAYGMRGGAWKRTLSAGQALPGEVTWYDLLSPTPDEIDAIEKVLGIEAPSAEDVQDLALSSRLYLEKGALVMVADIVVKSDAPHPESHAVTCIVTRKHFVTIRYSEPSVFAIYSTRLSRQPGLLATSELTFLSLLETAIDRTGTILHEVEADLDGLSRVVFWQPSDSQDKRIASTIGIKNSLYSIGRMGELSSRIRQSLVSMDRMLVFYGEYAKPKANTEAAAMLATMRGDVSSLVEHANYLAQKIGFLLDATLGFLGAEQNQVIKLFSVAAVILLPPTLVATVYGMNFAHMPELAWQAGYPFALLLMFLSALVPYLYFKKRKWI